MLSYTSKPHRKELYKLDCLSLHIHLMHQIIVQCIVVTIVLA